MTKKDLIAVIKNLPYNSISIKEKQEALKWLVTTCDVSLITKNELLNAIIWLVDKVDFNHCD